MLNGKYFKRSEVLTIWELIRRWNAMTTKHLEELINGDGGTPELCPYEWDPPVHGMFDKLLLMKMERGRLHFVEADYIVNRIEDEQGVCVASNVDDTDENGEPFLDILYFLAKDVYRIERPEWMVSSGTAETNTKITKSVSASAQAGTSIVSPVQTGMKYLTQKEAREYLRISKTEYYRLIEAGKLPIDKLIETSERKKLWPIEMLDEYLASFQRGRKP